MAGRSLRRRQLKVFLDCEACYADFLQTSSRVRRLRSRSHRGRSARADHSRRHGRRRVRVHAWRSSAAADSTAVTDTLKTVTETAATDDIIRRQLATSLRAGLLRFLTRDGVPPELQTRSDARVRGSSGRRSRAIAGGTGCSVSRARPRSKARSRTARGELGASASADRITPDWKITLGFEIDHETRGVRPRRGRARQGRTARTRLQLARRQVGSASTGRLALAAKSSPPRSTTRSWPSPRRRRSSSISFPYSHVHAAPAARAVRASASAASATTRRRSTESWRRRFRITSCP